MFLALLASAVLLFLTAAAALPDDAGAEIIDLRAHYARIARRFWLLTALQWTLANAVSIWAQMQIDGARLNLASPVFLMLPVMLVLAAVPWRWLHALGLVGLVLFYAVVSFGRVLG